MTSPIIGYVGLNWFCCGFYTCSFVVSYWLDTGPDWRVALIAVFQAITAIIEDMRK